MEARYFQEGLASVSVVVEDLQPGGISGVKWGYIDKSGVFVIEPVYFQVEPFHNGLAKVYLYDSSVPNPDSYAYIDKKGAIIWEPK